MSVNTVDTLFAAFPAFLYLNPELGGYLLSPLWELQDSSSDLLTSYAAMNIGMLFDHAKKSITEWNSSCRLCLPKRNSRQHKRST